MSSIQTFEDLQNLGVDSLYEHTHITRYQIELLLNKSFDKLSRVQFMGFVSILEREYSVDLSSLKEEYDVQNPILPIFDSVTPSEVLQAPSTSRSKWIVGGIGAIALLLVIASMTQGELSSAPKEEVLKLNTPPFEIVKSNTSAEKNITVEINATEINLSESNTTSSVATVIPAEDNTTIVSDVQGVDFGHALSIQPSSKVWVGMMDLATGEKNQRKTSKPIVIDTTKNWLFIFGHGRLHIVTSEGSRTLKERNVVWFSYENGVLKQLSREQFEEKNHGSRW
ncbi:MAG: hypothetical protein NTY39_00835 [Campylobacterales bacterium]|nr:hypothetical protein [Campylobacterales bacterium]